MRTARRYARQLREIEKPRTVPTVVYGLACSRYGSPVVEIRIYDHNARAAAYRLVADVIDDAGRAADPEISEGDRRRDSLPCYVVLFTFDELVDTDPLMERLGDVAGAIRVSADEVRS